jgi:hypothetical protein
MNVAATHATAVPAVDGSMPGAFHAFKTAANHSQFPELGKVRATFKPDSPLFDLFVHSGCLINVRFTKEKRDFYLLTIFGIVALFVSYFESFDVRNPHIIVCNYLKYALKADFFHFQHLPAFIMRQLFFDIKDYPVLERSFSNYEINPIWVRGYITDYIRPMNEKIIPTTMCKVNTKFLKFLRSCDVKSYEFQTKFTFEEICTTVANYFIPNTEPFHFSRFYFTLQVYKIKDTKLEHIFNVDYCSGIQCKMLIVMQITKYTNKTIPESRYLKAMRHDMNQYNTMIKEIVEAENNE